MATAYKPINGGGIQLRPFNTHKRWVVTDINHRSDSRLISVIKGISPQHGEKINVSESISIPAYRETDQLDNEDSNTTSFLKSKHQKIVWSGLNQMFFKHRARVERDLYASASIFSIPQNRLGDGIKFGSVEVVDTSMTSSDCESAIIKDRNSNDSDTNAGNNSAGNIIPTNKLLEKSGVGNKRNPPIKPIIIDA